MNKIPIFISWMLTIVLLYIAHMKLMITFPTPLFLISSTLVALYCYYKVALHFGSRMLN
jgi:hypothetical protein